METLEEIAKGGQFSDGDWVESKDQDPTGGVRLTQLADVGVGKFRDRSDRWLREDQAARLGCIFLKPDDVLVARMPDPLGRACLVPGSIGRAVTVVDVAIIRLSRSDIDPRYLMWALNAPLAQQQVVSMQSGTTRKRVSRKNLATVKIPIPLIEEQRRIVDILEGHLSRLDAASIVLRNQMARLAALRQSALTNAHREVIAKGAGVASIGQVATTDLGKMLDAKRAAGAPTPYLRNINVRWGRFDLADVSDVPLSDHERKRFALAPGDLLVCEGGEPGRCAVWTGTERLMTYQKALHRVRVERETMDPQFLALMLEQVVRSGTADKFLTGTTIKHLPQEKLRRIEVPVPELDAQQAVVARLSELEDAAGVLGGGIVGATQRAARLRRALLAAAFSGRLLGRSSDIETVEGFVNSERGWSPDAFGYHRPTDSESPEGAYCG